MELFIRSVVLVIVLATIGCCYSVRQDDINLKKCYKSVCFKPDIVQKNVIQEIKDKLSTSKETPMDVFGEFEAQSEALKSETSTCDLCKHSVSMTVTPLTWHGKEGEVFYIVRSSRYDHNITLNICESNSAQHDSTCFTKYEDILDEERSCRQHYSNIRFLVYDVNNKHFTEKFFQYESACVCYREKK